MAIIRPHLKKNYIGEETDPANLGIIFALTFRHDKQVLTLASVYWPSDNKGPESLWTRLDLYMKDQDIGGTVTAYCKQLVENVLDRTMADPGNTCVVGGDWNSNWQDSRASRKRSHPGIASWAQRAGLANALRPLLPTGYITRQPSSDDADPASSTIDHILTTQTAAIVTEAGISHAPIWQSITDHRPIWINLRLDVPLSLDKSKPAAIPTIRRVEINPDDHLACEELRNQLRTLCAAQPPEDLSGEDLGQWIEMVCASTVNIVRAHIKPLPKLMPTLVIGEAKNTWY